MTAVSRTLRRRIGEPLSTLLGFQDSDERLRHSVTRLLSATAILAYLIMLFGAVLARSDGHWLLAVAHHTLAIAGGVAIIASLVAAWCSTDRMPVLLSLVVASVLYPVQAAVGVWVWIGAPSPVGGIHLGLAMVIFGAVLYSLIWHLSDTEATERHKPQRDGTTTSESASSGPRVPAGSGRIRAVLVAYLTLMKPRLMWLLSLLALGGIGLAAIAGAALDGLTVLATLTGGILAVGASGTFNHVYERDRDRRMERTADRPVVADEVTPIRASAFGFGLAGLGLGILWAWTTPVATLLTALAIVYYSVIYTVLLKPSTTWNIAIGGGAGALPAVIGWAAITGGIGLPAIVLAGIVVVWTPAHFYNLAILHREDYEQGGFPMLPVVRGVALTRRRIGYSLAGAFIGAAILGIVSQLGVVFFLATAVGGVAFLATYIDQLIEKTPRRTYRTFHASNAFLALVLIGIVGEVAMV